MRSLLLELIDQTDDPAALADWLERRLVSLSLVDDAAMLRAIADTVNPEELPAAALDDILGDRTEQVLTNGLAGLERVRLFQLLRSPEALRELQAIVLEQGGAHWDRLIDASDEPLGPLPDLSGDVADPFDSETIAPTEPAAVDAVAATESTTQTELPSTTTDTPNAKSTAWLPWAIALGVLAAIGTLFVPSGQQPTIAWGWAAEDGLPDQTLDTQPYLDALATTGGTWGNRTPETREDLIQRIDEYIAGCKRVATHNHGPLSSEENAMLHTLCERWIVTMQTHRAELVAGADVAQTRIKLGTLVDTLTGTIADGPDVWRKKLAANA